MMEEVFKRLAKAGLRLKKGKCVFMEPQVTYLGHRVSKEGIQPMEDKVEAITNAPPPRNVLSGNDKLLPEILTKFVKCASSATQIAQ